MRSTPDNRPLEVIDRDPTRVTALGLLSDWCSDAGLSRIFCITPTTGPWSSLLCSPDAHQQGPDLERVS